HWPNPTSSDWAGSAPPAPATISGSCRNRNCRRWNVSPVEAVPPASRSPTAATSRASRSPTPAATPTHGSAARPGCCTTRASRSPAPSGPPGTSARRPRCSTRAHKRSPAGIHFPPGTARVRCDARLLDDLEGQRVGELTAVRVGGRDLRGVLARLEVGGQLVAPQVHRRVGDTAAVHELLRDGVRVRPLGARVLRLALHLLR